MKDESKSKSELLSELKMLKEDVSQFSSFRSKYDEIQEVLNTTRVNLNSILRSVPDIIYRLDQRGIITYVNEAIKEYGYSPEELIGKHIFEFVHPEDREKANYHVNERRTGERKTTSFEVRLLSKKRIYLTFEIKTKEVELEPIFVLEAEGMYSSEKPNPDYFLGTLGIARDVTERKQAERLILNSRERYKKLFEASNDGIIFMDDNKIIECNPKTLELFSCTEEELVGKQLDELSPTKQPDGRDSKEKGEELFNQAYGNDSQLFEWRFLRCNGTEFDANIRLISIDIWGKPHLLAYIRDISEQQRYEKEINMLAHAIMSISECVSVTDIQDRILFVNDAFEQTYGYKKGELLGKKIDIIRSPNNPTDVLEAILPATLQGGWQGEILSQSKDGREFPIFLSTSVIRNNNNKAIALIGVAKDMTERKLLENQLRQSQKMEAIGSLAGGVAHDFNNLLTVIRGYSELLLSKLSKKDPLIVSVKQIDKAAERAESLTRQLLAFSRRQILKPSVIDLNELIHEMEKMLQRIIGEDVNFITVLDSDLGKIKADRGQIEQVIMNIVVNARDAMIEGGKLTVETKNVYLEDTYVQNHPPVIPGHYILLAISDTGLGMDRETQAHIFEPFFTTKETGKGTGLGLATVYGIVKQSEGFIWVYSETNKGTTFKIYLPMVEDEVDTMKRNNISHPSLKGDETILIVEDEEDVRALIHETLHLYGYRVLDAPHGDSALLICNKLSNEISLIITDVVMPKMSGRELVDKVTSKLPEMKVLYMSGYTDNAIVHKGLLEPGTHFIQKPFTPLALLRKVREVLQSK